MPELPGRLIDSNVLLDVVTDDAQWADWSSEVIADSLRTTSVLINPIIYAEVSVGFDDIEELDRILPATQFRRAQLPYHAGFLAAKAHAAYRRRGGARTTTLPDFLIGAHAVVEQLTLVTRDPRRYRTAYPSLRLIAP